MADNSPAVMQKFFVPWQYVIAFGIVAEQEKPKVGFKVIDGAS